MISQVSQTPYISKPAPYPDTCTVNQLWSEIISPTRAQYCKEASFTHEPMQKLLCNTIYFPFEAEKVEYSSFWMQPHNVNFAAKINLETQESGTYSFELSTCGGAKVFVENTLAAQLYSYNRNSEATKKIDLELAQGKNTVYVLVNDLAERDTQFYFKLKYTDNKSLQAFLPVSADIAQLNEIRAAFEKIYLNNFNFSTNDIFLYFEEALKEPLSVEINLVFTDAHTKTKDSVKTVILNAGETKIFIGDLIYQQVGMVKVNVSAKSEDITLKRDLFFEYYDRTVMPTVDIDTIAQRKDAVLEFISMHGTNNFQKAVAILYAKKNKELAQDIIDDELFRINSRYDCSDFRIPALIYAYKSTVFSAQQKQKIKKTLLDFRYWFDEDGNDVMWFFSENHALCFHASELLAGELFENEIFSNSGMTGIQHRQKAKKLILAWFDNFFKTGFNEWNSAVYIPIDMIAFFALYDMVNDPEIKQLAKLALDRTFKIFAINSYKGIVSASYGRIYFKNLVGRRTGESAAINFIANKEGYLNQNCFSTVLFALSAYEPPQNILQMYNVTTNGKEYRCFEGEEKVELYNFKTPNYIISSAANYKVGKPGTQEHMLQIMIKDCDTQIWINHPGEAAFFGEGRPSYFAGNGTLPQVEQDKNFAKVTFSLLEQEVDFTHAYCPLKQFDIVKHEDKWLFLQKDNVYVAIYADNAISITRTGALKNYELISYGKNNFWTVLLDTNDNYDGIDSFAKYAKQKNEFESFGFTNNKKRGFEK